MKDNKLQNGINELRKISMTVDEKKYMLNNILSSTVQTKTKPENPWVSFSLFLKIQNNRFVFYSVIFLFILMASGGVAFASTSSLPDSILYPIKVGVVEPIIGTFKLSPEDKAQYESSLATERMVEAETLANKGKLNYKNEKKLNKLLITHTNAFNNTVDKISKTKSSKKLDEIVTNYNAEMNAHAQVLDIVSSHIEGQDNTSNDNPISKTARTIAGQNMNNLKNRENVPSDKYASKKKDAEAAIESTSNDISRTKANNSPKKNSVVNNVSETLNQAKHLYNEANKKESEGNSKDAYSKLIDSEAAAKEARVFLEASMKYNHD
jgi:hypothetical protein